MKHKIFHYAPLFLTKTSLVESDFFRRTDFIPLWQSAVISATDSRIFIDVPVRETNRYHMIFFDGVYYKLTESHHSLTFMIDKCSGSIYCYNHFFLPQMNSTNWPGHYDENLYFGYYGLSSRDSYTGLEIYSTPTGRIVSMDVYEQGERKSHTYAFDNERGEESIVSFFDSFAVLAFKETKTKTLYSCPICDGEFFWEDETIGYICVQCNYIGFYEEELEPAQIIGNHGGSGGGEEEDWWSDWPNRPEPDPWWNPDDEFGGGGGYSGGGGGGQGNSNTGGGKMDTLTFAGNPRIKMLFPSGTNSFVVENLKTTLDSIYSNPSLQGLVEALEGQTITLVKDETLPNGKKALTHRSTRRIRWAESSPAVITEEFFHIYQYQNPSFKNRNDAYYEFEVKCFLVVIYGTSALVKSQGCSALWDAAQGYLGSPSYDSFVKLRDALRFWGSYDISHLYYIEGQMLPNMRKLDIEIQEMP